MSSVKSFEEFIQEGYEIKSALPQGGLVAYTLQLGPKVVILLVEIDVEYSFVDTKKVIEVT